MTRLLGTRDLHIGVIVALSLVCWLGDGRLQKAAGQEGTTVEAIETVWREREDKTKTLQFEWTGSVTYAKEFLPTRSHFGAGAGPTPSAAQEPTPLQDVTHKYRLTLTMDRYLFRFTRDGPDWVMDEGRFVPRIVTSIFDGAVEATYFSAATDGSPATNLAYPLGFRSKATAAPANITDFHHWGVVLAFRPLYATRHIMDSPMRATGDQGVVDGRSCVLLKTKGNVAAVCWVDVARACSIARYECTVDGNLLYRVDVSYEPNDAHGWVPTAWRWTLLIPSTSRLQQSGKAQLTAYTINAPVDPSLFEARFPADMWVEDQITGEQYIARADGTKRLVTTDEQRRGARYLDVLHTDSGAALSPGAARGWSGKILIGALLALAVVSIVAWMWMRWYRRRGDLPTQKGV